MDTLQTGLWSGVLERLRQGEPMVRPSDFEDALEAEFCERTGKPMPDDLRAQLRVLIVQLLNEHPETYLAQGVQNAVRRAFEAGVHRKSWNHAAVERQGWQVIRRFLRSERVRDLFDEIQLNPQSIDASRCVRDVIDNLQPGLAQAPATPAARAPAAAADPAPAGTALGPKRYKQPLDTTVAAAAEEAGIDAATASARVQEQQALQVKLTQREMKRLAESLDAYLADGLIDEAQAQQMRALLNVDEREQAGEIGASEAEDEREQILPGEQRRALRVKVDQAVQSTVGYLQVFESLKKISQRYDGFLQLLVQHKDMVTDASAGDRTPLLATLSTSTELLDLALDVVGRADAEVRLLAVRLPPYSKVAPQRLQPIANLTVEPAFVEQLRTLSAEALSERFRAPAAEDRARPAADILSLIHLIDQVVEPTPLRFKLRMLEANRILQELQPRVGLLYQSEDPAEARRKGERILRQRLDRQFGDASTEEQQAAKKRGEALLMAMDQKAAAVADGGAGQVEEALAETDDNDANDANDDPDAITDEELQRGVQLARVEMRVAGRPKRIPTKIMPDPDDEERFVMAQRDPETGELAPQMRRGKKRFVERVSDGTWKAI